MMKKFYLLILIVSLNGIQLLGQEYSDLQLTNSSYGTITALTSTADSITSDGLAGVAKNYNGRQAIVYQGKCYFMAINSESGDELWVTDGTREGTLMIKDINPGSVSSTPTNLVGVNGVVYFVATTTSEGTELWKTDGTEAGTTLVIDLVEGEGSASPNTITPFNNGFLFAAIDDESNNYGDDIPRQHIWFSDGSAERTVRLSANNVEGVQPKTSGMDAHQGLSHFQLIGDTLAVFAGTSEKVIGTDGDTDLIMGEEIWVTNGTPEPWGTKMLVDINPPTDNSNIQWLYSANEEQVIFRSKTPGEWNGQDDLVHLENEYWVTDGSVKGTYLLQDYNDAPGNEANTTANTGSAYPIAYDNKIYYRADGAVGNELTRITGLSGNGSELELAYDIAPFDGSERSSFLDDLIVFDGKLFFKANFRSTTEPNYERLGQELAVFDSETDAVLPVAEIFVGQSNNSFPRNKVIVNGRMYMTANTGANQSEYDIWCMDIAGEGEDPTVEDIDNVSLMDRYTVFKIFDDVDGLNQVLATDLLNLNENLIFKTIDGTLVLYDDGLDKVTEPYQDEKAVGPEVSIGANAYLNAAPLVSITGPESGETLVEGADIEITVNLNDPEGDDITKVEFYTGDFYNTWDLIGTSVDGNFTFNWDDIPASAEGIPTRLTAVAFDENDSSFSMPVDILVEGNTPPTVELVLPESDIEVEYEAEVEISATASDDLEDGLNVAFYNGDELLFNDDESPYGFVWTAPSEDATVSIKAIATDKLGETAESEIITVTVVEPLTTSSNHEIEFEVYPNPVISNVLNIRLGQDDLQASFINLQGQVVYKTDLQSGMNELALDQLGRGIYVVQISTLGERSNLKFKIIVE